MGTTHVIILLCWACKHLPVVRSVTCTWPGSIESEGACFLYNKTALSYANAKNACKSSGGVLAKVKSKAQLLDITTLPNNKFVWIGANDIENEGTWVWEDDGSAATELNQLWITGEPSNTTDQDCAFILNFEIGDVLCSYRFPSLCMEKETMSSLIPANDPANTNTAGATTGTSESTKTATIETETGATAAVATSVPLTSATPISTSKKNDANGIPFNVLFILYLFAFIYRVI